MTSTVASGQQRRLDIDIARAVAIVAVVAHHIRQYFLKFSVPSVEKSLGEGVSDVVIIVALPLFFLLSGLVLGLSRNQGDQPGTAGSFVRGKFLRLMIPFAAVTLIHAAVKLAAPGYNLAELPQGALRSLIAPRAGLAGHLWFIYTLMILFALWPLLARALGRWPVAVVLGAALVVALAPIPWPKLASDIGETPLLSLEDVAWHLPFFLIGFWYSRRGRALGTGGAILGTVVAGAVLVAGFAVRYGVTFTEEPVQMLVSRLVKMATGLGGTFFLLWSGDLLARASAKAGRAAAFVGLRAYDVYLLHVALVGYPVAFVLSKLKPASSLGPVLFVGATIVTCAVSIGLGEIVRRIPPLAKVVLGIRTKRDKPKVSA